MSKGIFLNVSAAGHVIPTLGLVRELVARGEEIVYFEIPPFQGEIESFGARFRPYPPIRPYPGPGGANQYYLAPVSAWCALEWVPQLLDAVRAEAPDYIVHDSLCLWGRIIAHVLGVPAIASVATAGFNAASFHGCPRLRPQRRAWIAEARDGLRLFRDWRRTLQQTYHLPRPLSLVDVFSNPQPLNLVYLPRALQPYAERFDARHEFVGLCTPSRPHGADFPFAWLDARPLVYVSFGTIHDPGREFFRACIAALGNLPVQAVIVLSPRVSAAELGPVPDHILVRAAGTAPQVRLLERAAVFITHCGGGGLREGATLGVPMLAVPQTYEQEILAARLEALGAGLLLPPVEVDADKLQAGVRRLLEEPAFRHRGQALAAAARAAGGATRAADVLLQHVKGALR